MSIIGITSQTQSYSLYQYLQSLNSPGATGPTAAETVHATDSPTTTAVPGSIQSTGGATPPPTSSGSTLSTESLAQQLATAIQNALNGVNSSQSNNPQDVLATIEQAIQGTLQSNGIGPGQLSQTGGHHHHGHGGGHGGGSGGAVLSALFANDPSSSSSSSNASPTSGNSSSTSQTPGLNALLSQLNVDPQQFRSDIISAVSSSQDGTVNLSQVFQSVPAGQTVNVQA
jgi:hypothetical protein